MIMSRGDALREVSPSGTWRLSGSRQAAHSRQAAFSRRSTHLPADLQAFTTLAPWRPTGQTHKSEPTLLVASNARCIASPAARAISSVPANAKIDGPDPDRMHPSAPAIVDGVVRKSRPATPRSARAVSTSDPTAGADPTCRRRDQRADFAHCRVGPSTPRDRRSVFSPHRSELRSADAAARTPGHRAPAGARCPAAARSAPG